MDQFVDVFIQEANELIDELEGALLVLESSPSDPNSLDSVFRVMHTLKGNAKMFGFDQIGQLTHQLENIYDNARSSKVAVNNDTLSITLKSVDHLRKLLRDPALNIPENQNRQKELLTFINNIQLNQQLSVSNPDNTESTNIISDKKSSDVGTYYIAFHPNQDIMSNGTNPIYILEDLSVLGKIKINAHKKSIPDFDQIDPTICYVFWEIYLVTNCSIDEIKEVFIFVEDSSRISIHKVADEDLLKNESFVEKIEEIKQEHVLINIDELQQYVNHLLQIIRQNTIKETTKKDTVEQKISSIRVSSEKIDDLMNLVSELVTTQAGLSNISDELNLPGLTVIAENVEKLSRQLRDNVFSVSLIPINHLFMRFQRMVRDLSKELGKDVDFIVEGGETELDKNLIETLSDPIMHILRNCLDHGIESQNERQISGKSEKGRIVLKAYYSGSQVIIKVSDNGAGLDHGKIKRKAIEKGIITANEDLDEKQISNLLFLPGFSTAKEVTDVSGRGVGMDIVKKKIDEIRGEVSIESITGQGTSITIRLPLTLSIIDGLLVTVEETSYIIQVASVNKINVLDSDAVRESYNNLVIIDGEQIQIVDLRREFMYGEYEESYVQVVVVEFEGVRIGIVVDKVIGQIQTVIKPLGKMYKDQEYISGATILGNGTVALILDTNKLIYQSVN